MRRGVDRKGVGLDRDGVNGLRSGEGIWELSDMVLSMGVNRWHSTVGDGDLIEPSRLHIYASSVELFVLVC